MRENPNIPTEKIAACLREQYDLAVVSVRYLPTGYDLNAFVYEVLTAEGTPYFVKIRSGEILAPGLNIPHALAEQGIPNILAPIPTKSRALWGFLDTFSVIVYPFIRGENALAAGLSDNQWREFGFTLQAVHSSGLASPLRGQVPAETFTIPSARLVRRLSACIAGARWESPSAARLAAFWTDNASLIEHLCLRAQTLGKQLRSRPFEPVLCHADIHAANILVSEESRIFLIDWDSPLLAPRERDLFFIAPSCFVRPITLREEQLFFQGYGPIDRDPTAIAYYRYERALEDIGAFGQSVLENNAISEEAKAEEAEMLFHQFESGQIVEAALEADRNASR